MLPPPRCDFTWVAVQRGCAAAQQRWLPAASAAQTEKNPCIAVARSTRCWFFGDLVV